MWYWPKDRNTEQRKRNIHSTEWRTKNLEIDPCTYGQLIFNKCAKEI